MRRYKHLPINSMPAADVDLFRQAYSPGDIFDDTGGPGAHFTSGTRKMVGTAYRRWLGFLSHKHPLELELAPADRIVGPRVSEYIDVLLKDMTPISAAICVKGLFYVAGFADPAEDWRWLGRIAVRLRARSTPKDRFHGLVPGWLTLDHGIGLMDEAYNLPSGRRLEREIFYRDGLIMALLSCWPLRRRSITALTVSRHLEIHGDHVVVLLHAQDMKSKRPESYQLHERLVPYLKRYLKEIRPRLLRQCRHDGLWASPRGRPLSSGRLYDVMRLRTHQRFNKRMGLHDFRRAAATFVATEAPEMVGWIPGISQQAGSEVGEKHYNLARSITASRRLASTVTEARQGLRLRLDPEHPSRGLR